MFINLVFLKEISEFKQNYWSFSKWFWLLENENNFGDFIMEFWLKTIEFGDITNKSVGDF
jgi:hypothetical protein